VLPTTNVSDPCGCTFGVADLLAVDVCGLNDATLVDGYAGEIYVVVGAQRIRLPDPQ